jgi:asparagine N-glycosylation enzyme membrane subunit Stt3
MLITILLALSLFLLLYSLVAKELPDPEKTIKEKIVRSALSIISAGLFFLFSSLLFKTIFAGIPWGTLGWFLPGWIKSSIQAKKHNKIKAMARNFITTGAAHN